MSNCQSHPHIENLKAVKLYFSPPNTTSKTQPMYQGVIRLLKVNYLSVNYSKSREEKNPSKNFVAARNAHVSNSLECETDKSDRELFSKVWNIHRNPGNYYSRR